MKTALIVIDYTYDFIASDGRLTCGAPGQQIEGYVLDVTKEFVDASNDVVFAVDVHDEGDPFHPETRLFPPHNVRGTSGRGLYGAVGQYFQSLQDQGLPSHVRWMDKTRYSAFAGTDLDVYLRARRIEELHLVGVCTDICVLHTAVDAYNKAYRTVVHGQGVASFNEVGHQWALEHFQGTLGAEVV